MNQIQVLLTNLNKAKELCGTLNSNAPITAKSGWQRITGEESYIDLLIRMNELTSIALKLNNDFKIDNEIENEDHESDWVNEVIDGLSLHGNFITNINRIHNHTLTIIRKSVRTWNQGYKVQSNLDEEKIDDLLLKLKVERNEILFDELLTFDLKKILLKEIDKLIYSLENFSILGEEFLKDSITEFYSEAFFNKDIQQIYQNRTSFKDIIDAVSASITIGTFTPPAGAFLLGVANEVINKIV